jgi:hypothetical protein
MHRKAEHRDQSEGAASQGSSKRDAAESAARSDVEQAEGGDAAAELDFEALDLSIETVEERISPSETNVFDK